MFKTVIRFAKSSVNIESLANNILYMNALHLSKTPDHINSFTNIIAGFVTI